MDKNFLKDLVSPSLNDNGQLIKEKKASNLYPSRLKPKKITLITHTLCRSGAPKVVLDLAVLLQGYGHKLNVISIWEGPLRKDFESPQYPRLFNREIHILVYTSHKD